MYMYYTLLGLLLTLQLISMDQISLGSDGRFSSNAFHISPHNCGYFPPRFWPESTPQVYCGPVQYGLPPPPAQHDSPQIWAPV